MFGLITGSGFYDIEDLGNRSENLVQTPYGDVSVTMGQWRGQPVCFLARHGPKHSIAPHAINYRANIWALRNVGATVIMATAVSGGIRTTLQSGQLVLISDFIDFTSGRACTFFDGETDPGFDHNRRAVAHTDMTNPYDPAMREMLRRAATAESIDLVDGAVYCATNGPRFETPAEIVMMGRLGGDLVGMTGYPEVALAREADIPYASVGIVSNPAAGLADGELSESEIFSVIEQAADPLYRLIARTIELHAAGPTS